MCVHYVFYQTSPYAYDLSTSDDEFPVFDLNQKTIKKSQVQTERLLFIFVTKLFIFILKQHTERNLFTASNEKAYC